MERERDPVGDDLEELDQSLVKRRRVFVPTCITPTRSPCASRGTPRRELTPLEQDRVQDGAVIDPVEGDGHALCRDATGEPLPHGDANTLFHLLLDAFGGPRHELVPGLVEQEDGRRVGVEGLSHA